MCACQQRDEMMADYRLSAVVVVVVCCINAGPFSSLLNVHDFKSCDVQQQQQQPRRPLKVAENTKIPTDKIVWLQSPNSVQWIWFDKRSDNCNCKLRNSGWRRNKKPQQHPKIYWTPNKFIQIDWLGNWKKIELAARFGHLPTHNSNPSIAWFSVWCCCLFPFRILIVWAVLVWQ